ncbi:MAG: agmatine deiminase family protein [Bacteroidales bacterium]|jgi:agmatine/peptidylarginine deiminase|nr:agmatine deiminase family protein [Bacteroidales bacterium]
MKIFISIILILLNFTIIFAQEQIPQTFEGKHHMLSPVEFDGSKNKNFTTTTPPEGFVRNIAEFEPNQGVIIAYPYMFGIPTDFIRQLSEDVKVYLLCSNSMIATLTQNLQNSNVNMQNIEFINSQIDSYWTRDYSPLFIEYSEDRKIGLVDFPYNRPRPNDDDIPSLFGSFFEADVFGMDLTHTGGNYMTDGLGVAASCDLVYTENSDLSYEEITTMVESYLGITNYHLLEDPLDDYIEHIDCWGKFLDIDKILITKVSSTDYRYADFEAMADYWANQTSSYGNKYKVYRTYSPNGQPYTNSLIVNNKVYVPIVSGTGSQYNTDALETYENAMPGYEIIGISHTTWESTDALHCRTHEVPDFEMLRISHFPFVDTVSLRNNYDFTAEIYCLNNSGSITSVSLFLKINNGDFTEYEMTNIQDNIYSISLENFNQNDSICYFIKATDSNLKTENHPYIGHYDPHKFYIKDSQTTDAINVNIEEKYIKAFPNPVKNVLYIIANNLPEDIYQISIFNQQGNILKTFELNISNNQWNKFDLDISDLSSGFYFINATNNKNSYSSKFVKQ